MRITSFLSFWNDDDSIVRIWQAITENRSSLIVLRLELHDNSEWLPPKSIFWPGGFSVSSTNERRNWSSVRATSLHGLALSESHNQCKNWNSVGAAFTSAMNMVATEWKCWKIRWQKTEIWARIGSGFLIDRLSETCQDRSLLETPAQPNCTYFCT